MFEPLTTEFFSAKYYTKNPTLQNKEKGIYFRYERITERSKRFSTPINNLIAKEGRYSISTTYSIRFKCGGYVLDQDGKMYIISDYTTGQSQNEHRALLFKPIENITVLSLTEVANPLELNV